ncbi:eukaryotic translation initiation factor 4 gamma isoform X2 [Drosophila novamexicana]|uniref:eukaryotic translation initiation factor 4 gamma isoform X2 n=1 Tax=Drosophila novamexicana TaxID=47314 RepID=UPI0011E5B7C2|nr:eukaryotic translation initiation factor 4 gamma isoform X2 [Drosophila novamexicana]
MKASSNCDRVLIIGAHDSCVLSIDKCRCRKKYSENMASLEGQQENYSNNPAVENIPKRPESREGSAERKASKDREEKLRYARDRQNEERQKKIEELRAQAEAAQKYREQKEEERRRRIEEIRVRDTEKRHQVEERKKAIIEAEKERREFILKKNQERESRIETKRRDRNSIAFAFGSSTPRLLDVPADYGLVSPSTFWSQRRSTSISNVAGASLSRRSSERELADSGAKKRASSSTDRHDDHRRKSSSMYEVFNWGYSNDEPPKRFSLSIAGSEINIDGPAPIKNNAQILTSNTTTTTAHRQYTTTATASHNNNNNYNNNSYRKEDNVDTTQNMMFRSVYRRKTDLMPTIPSPRDGHYGSRSSLSTTPRTPGRAYSMNRLDQLAQPIRRNGEHVRAILERERRERELEMLDETSSLGGGSTASSRRAHLRGKRAGSASVGASGTSSAAGIMSRSMTHLAAGGGQRERGKYSLGGGISTSFRPLGSGPRDSSSRSGNVTPGGHGHLSGSRPGSAMSTSTTLSTAGPVTRRPATAPRKPRPASIAGTGMSLEEINKLKRDNKPPMKTTTTTNAASPTTSTAQTTPKRTPNLMSTSMIVTSSSTRMHSAEKKTPQKRETLPPKAASASRAQPSRTASMERINRRQKESATKSAASAMSASMIVTSSTGSVTTAAAVVPAPTPEANGVVKEPEELAAKLVPVPDAALAAVSKAEKEALNTVKTEQVQQQELVQIEAKTQPEPEPEHQTEPAAVAVEKTAVEPTAASLSVEEKADEGNEKVQAAAEPIVSVPKKALRNGSKENSEVRELTPPTANLSVDSSNDLMTASMIAKKITTEEEAKAALAERRRLAREEAERQAELERQRLEAERLAELKAQEEEAERQRLFEEESTRLAEEQRRGEEERLRKAIEEAQQREEEEQRRREEEERQRIEREEAEKKAKEEAEKQRIEVAERLKREEKEREERRKRVEAIMSRTRKGGAAATTPAKESADTKAVAAASSAPKENDVNSSSSNSTDGSPSSSSTINDAPAPAAETETDAEPPNSQAMYEQSVLDKENSLINSFANMIIDENAKNLHQFEVSNGKLHVETIGATTPAAAAAAAAVANGNGHIENVNNKNDINLLQDAVTPAVTQLIDLSIESQQDLHINNNNNNNNNNNSLLTSTAANNTLVTADSHENKDISLL